MDNHKEEPPVDGISNAGKGGEVEENRRKLMTKLAAGAFAIPAVLASISAQAAPSSGSNG